MIDRLMGYYAGYKFKDVDSSYQPSMAIQSSQLSNEKGGFLTVLFPPWRGGDGAYNVLAKRLAKRGSAVLSYKFHHDILEPDVERTIGSFTYIQSTVVNELKRLAEAHHYKDVYLIGSSLGNVSLALVAKAFPDFTSATMVVAGSNLARCVWEGDRTQSIRQGFEAQGIDEATLARAWQALAPMSAGSSFAGKDVHMIVSTTDKIIPATYQQEMVETVATFAERMDVKASKLGHIASVANYCLRG